MNLGSRCRIVWLGLLATTACTTPAPSDFASLERAAERGDARAQTELALLYAEGDEGVQPNDEKCIFWLRRAAESGHPRAQSLLGSAYGEGRGVLIDHQAAIAWHRKAAHQGESASRVALGRYFLSGVDTTFEPGRGMFLLRPAAEAGEAEAQALLGRVYLRGIGRRFVKRDTAEAKKWLTASAEQGFAQAQSDLATLYFDEGDSETGMDWLQQAAAQEQTEALTMLSQKYRDGDGLAADAARSEELLRRAATLGDPVAQTQLGVALREGAGMERNESESVGWFEKAAIQGYIQGQFNLGLAYAYGTGVDPDPVRGTAWLEICAKERYREAIRAVSPVRRQLSAEQREAVALLREQLAAGLPKLPAPVLRRW